MRRLFLHVGLAKSGTTYLQQVWRANADALAEGGLWTPAKRGEPRTMLAVWDLAGRRPRGADDDRVAGRWQELVDAVCAHQDRDVLLSEEYLATRTPRQARRAVHDLGAHHEVHVLVTARDVGRVLASAWQEDVKSGGTGTWPAFIDAVRDPGQAGSDPARGFWLRQDLPQVLALWADAAGPGRVHLVTVPPRGSDAGTLPARVGWLVGYDAARLREAPRRTNASFGAPATEVVRRLNELLGGRLNQRQYDRVVKHYLETHLRPATTTPMGLPAKHLGWAREEACRQVEAVRAAGYDVVGDLDDLLPTLSAGRGPDEATDAELLDASLEALRAVVESHAHTWWLRRRPDTTAPGTAPTRASSVLRSAGYRLRRKGADLADQHTVASAAMSVYLSATRARSGPRPRR